MVRDDAEVRILVEYAAEDEPCEGGGRVERPAERLVDLRVLGLVHQFNFEICESM